MKFYHLLKPNTARVILFIALAAYFLSVKSVGFYTNQNESTLKTISTTTIVGYPYTYFKTAPQGNTYFSARNTGKNIVFYYLLSCLLIAFFQFTLSIYRNNNSRHKVFYTSILLNTVLGIALLLNVFGGDWLTDAAVKGDKKSMEFLITLGIDPNSMSSNGKLTALIVAAQKNNPQIAKLLIDAGVDLNTRNILGKTPLHEAVNANSTEIVSILLAGGADVNSRDYTKSLPIHYIKKYEIAKILVKNNANIIFRNNKGYPPIFFAPDEKTLNLFRRNGARLNVSIQDGSTLLDITNNPSIIKYLINQGAPINSRNAQGDTPLHKLIKYQKKKNKAAKLLIKILVKRGANVDGRDRRGYSALHYTIKKCDISTGRFLVNYSSEAKAQLKRKKLKGKLKKLAIRNPACWDKIQLGYKASTPKPKLNSKKKNPGSTQKLKQKSSMIKEIKLKEKPKDNSLSAQSKSVSKIKNDLREPSHMPSMGAEKPNLKIKANSKIIPKKSSKPLPVVIDLNVSS